MKTIKEKVFLFLFTRPIKINQKKRFYDVIVKDEFIWVQYTQNSLIGMMTAMQMNKFIGFVYPDSLNKISTELVKIGNDGKRILPVKVAFSI